MVWWMAWTGWVVSVSPLSPSPTGKEQGVNNEAESVFGSGGGPDDSD